MTNHNSRTGKLWARNLTKKNFIKVLTHYNKNLFGPQTKSAIKVLRSEPIEIDLDVFLSLMSICLVILIAFVIPHDGSCHERYLTKKVNKITQFLFQGKTEREK